MSGIEDARSRRDSAKDRLKSSDYAGAIRESRMCVELSIKALLDMLGINYTTERRGKRIIPHDVSDKVPEAFKEVMPYLEDYEIKPTKEELARAMVVHKLLSSIRNYVEYPIKELGIETKEVFNYTFSSNLAKILVDMAEHIHWRIHDLINKIKRGKESIILCEKPQNEESRRYPVTFTCVVP